MANPMPPAPDHAFASDNAAGAHPAVLAAMQAANEGHALAYGDDRWTAEAADRFRDLFGGAAEPFLVWNGTGANVMALTTLLRPAECVVTTATAHIHVDEAGAPEFITGAKLIVVPTDDGRLTAEHVEHWCHWQGNPHHAQPKVVSITQSTEMGAVYSPSDIAAICEVAHRHGMYVHLDGARLANATAALGGTREALRSSTVDAGVDVVSFGGTKAGAVAAEAVVFLSPELASRAHHTRKLVTQLPSKMRFVAAQFNALLHDDLWIRLAQHSNAMAARLYEATRDIPGVQYDRAPEVNSVFPCLPRAAIAPLAEWCFFWEWEPTRDQVRWMTSWDTTDRDIDRFAAGVRHLLAT